MLPGTADSKVKLVGSTGTALPRSRGAHVDVRRRALPYFFSTASIRRSTDASSRPFAAW